MKKKQIRLWIVFLVASTVVLMATSEPTGQTAVPRPSIITEPGQDGPKSLNPKIDPALYILLHPETEAALEPARVAAGVRRVEDLDNGMAQVVVEVVTGPKSAVSAYPEVQGVRNMIVALGGTYETSYENFVQGRVPIATVENLAQSELVRFIRRPLRPVCQTISEGVAKTGANEWHSLAPYRRSGSHPKIAVLDLGFMGYASLLGSDLPSTVTTKSFRADGSLSADQIHGAACAEIVYDMYPDADLYLVNFSTDIEQHNAVDWLIAQGVQVISYSIGWWNAGDGKGTGPIDEDVKKAAARSIMWASAAGNYALDHWEGTYSDTNANGWHNFEPANEFLNFWVTAYTPVAAFLNWDDWGNWSGSSYSGSAQDYDLYLYIWSGGYWYLVDYSIGSQTGREWPTESIAYWYTTTSTYWGVAIRRRSTTRNCKLELFTVGNSGAIEYNVPEGSLTIPADSPDAIAAGATDWSTDAYHTYSSRGPTHDGRTKPDFAAPSGVSTSTYGPNNFYGTSASAPHLAGAFGLVKDKTAFTMAQIRQILTNRAVNLGDPNKFGAGRLNLLK